MYKSAVPAEPDDSKLLMRLWGLYGHLLTQSWILDTVNISQFLEMFQKIKKDKCKVTDDTSVTRSVAN